MIRPDEITSVDEIAGRDAFFLRSGRVDAWFERRSDILIVTFYNLATVGEHEIPHPWFYGNVTKQGYSVLGLIAKKKDWYRNDDTPRVLQSLREAGLFGDFRRVLFTGASMGGFAALTYSKLVPGSGVLAFSPQSTLAADIAPFEGRYSRPQKRFDWSCPNYSDAVDGLAMASDITIVFDPFVPEDKAHSKRLEGSNVRFLHVGHMGHQAIRVLKQVGMLPTLLTQIAENRFDDVAFFRALRERRLQMRWLRQCFGAAEQRGHARLVQRAANSIQTSDPRMRRYLARVQLRMNAVFEARQDHVIGVKDPVPSGTFKGRIDSLANAYVVPLQTDSPPNAFGVLDARGTWCRTSQS